MVRRTIHAIQINTKSYHRLYEHFSIYFLCFFAIFLKLYKDFLKKNQNLTLQYVDHPYTACIDIDIIVTGFHCDAWYSLVNVAFYFFQSFLLRIFTSQTRNSLLHFKPFLISAPRSWFLCFGDTAPSSACSMPSLLAFLQITTSNLHCLLCTFKTNEI